MRLSPDASSIGAKNTTKARARSAFQRLGGRATGGETVCCVTDCPRLVDLGRRRPGRMPLEETPALPVGFAPSLGLHLHPARHGSGSIRGNSRARTGQKL